MLVNSTTETSTIPNVVFTVIARGTEGEFTGFSDAVILRTPGRFASGVGVTYIYI